MSAVEHLTLTDGRILEFRRWGSADGLPVIFCHGSPGAGRPIQVLEQAAQKRGLSMVSPTRPGFGGSTAHPGRRVVDVVNDIDELLRALSISRCAVMGWSGGGPHALACAARLPQVVTAVIIAGVAPFDAEGLDWLAGMGEQNVEEYQMASMGGSVLAPALSKEREALLAVSAAELVDSLSTLLPHADRAAIAEGMGEDLIFEFREALRSGIDGWLDDSIAFTRPWGFSLEEIVRTVTIWHGTDDLMVPTAHGRWLAQALPSACLHVCDGEGHLSVAQRLIEDIFTDLRRTLEV